VRSGEYVTCGLVIESPFAGFTPPHQLEVPSVVLDMASLTLPVLGSCMQPGTCRDPRAEEPMAIETAVGRHALASLMASQAMTTALEIGMGMAQLARGDLSPSARAHQQTEDRRQQDRSRPIVPIESQLPPQA
jgi:hypothetical protein